MRFSAGLLTSAGSTTLPLASVYGSASGGGRIREIHAANTSSTAVAIKLVRITTAGTRGTAATSASHDTLNFPDALSTLTLYNTHSSTAPTLGDDLGYRTVLGAAAGSGIIWTFGDAGLVVPATANAGVGIIIENGTGQALQTYFVWDV